MIRQWFGRLRSNWLALGLAVLLHAALGALLIMGGSFITAHPLDAPGRGTEHEPIQAVAVKESDFKAAQTQIEQAEQAKQQHVQELKEQAAAAKAAREKAQAERKQARQKQARLKQKRQQAEEQAAQKAAARKKKLARMKRQAEEAAQKREAAQAEAAEAKKAAEAARKKREAEQKRIAEAKAKAKAKAKAEAKARRQAKMKAAMKAEHSRHRERVLGNWIAAIRATVTGNWNRPASAPPDLDCKVRITQLQSGEVIGAEILNCNGGAAVEQSITSAIYKSSPLPTPSDPDVFQRQIIFDFNPGGPA